MNRSELEDADVDMEAKVEVEDAAMAHEAHAAAVVTTTNEATSSSTDQLVDVSEVVLEWITTTFPGEALTCQEIVVPRGISCNALSRSVVRAYRNVSARMDDADFDLLHAEVASHIGRHARSLDRSDGRAPTEEELETLEQAFTAEFVGHAHERLFACIRECWALYSADFVRFRYPYFGIVQSSGFGKSRLLRECARLGHAIHRDKSTSERYHLLYVCARDIPSSTGYPVATNELRERLFPRHKEKETTDTLVGQLNKRLVELFDFVMQASPLEVDEMLFRLFSKDAAAQAPFCKPPSGSPLQRTKHDGVAKVLIVAIDEARALLPTQPDMKNIGWFRCFRRALYNANRTLRASYGDRAGIFGIVVDTNSKVSDFAPSARADPSLRSISARLFPPFVLTDTVDIFHTRGETQSLQQRARIYKDSVLAAVSALALQKGREERSEPTSWQELTKLGRPLWASRALPFKTLAGLAADKLLNGRDSDLGESFNLAGLGGAASVLCRLGVRPYASTQLASQAVADFMATLSYVSTDREQFFVSYSSEPMLTIGATKLWHSIAQDANGTTVSTAPAPGASSHDSSLDKSEDSNESRRSNAPKESNLSKYILPRLNVLLRQEVLDTGGIGEFVARIVLLLAMDACAVLETGHEKMRWQGAGEFYCVSTFLRALEGASVAVHERRGEPVKSLDDARKDMKKWDSYFVSFTHFVQLSEEPTERHMWGLLGRRAAAIMPRGQKGADLLIPICRPDGTPCKRKLSVSDDTIADAQPALPPLPPTVTMILVQVKNSEKGCSSYCEAATKKLDPEFVFSKGNSLANTQRDHVLRVCMSLREKRLPSHKYLEDMRFPGSFALGILGLGPWSSLRLTGQTVDVVSSRVATELSNVLSSWWRVADKVDADLDKGSEEQRIESDSVIRATAVRPLAANLV